MKKNKCESCLLWSDSRCGAGVAPVNQGVNCIKPVPKTIKPGAIVICSVAIMGAKRGTGWRYTVYEADKALKSGYRFLHATTGGMYPNIANDKWSEMFEVECREKGLVVVSGRPIAGKNAPAVT